MRKSEDVLSVAKIKEKMVLKKCRFYSCGFSWRNEKWQ